VKLVDTSCWVQALRRNGDAAVREQVRALMEAGEAAWCPIVRLELWNGVGSDHDRRSLKALSDVLPELSMDDEVWQAARDLADRCRKAGKTAPVQDVLIAACARQHGVEVMHDDAHFAWLMVL
jgi:predicted nucleic acid-binding protein